VLTYRNKRGNVEGAAMGRMRNRGSSPLLFLA
jgi:hypothetical protein